MGALRQRLSWSEDGALHDGPRRYLMMRTDVLMGTLLRLTPEAQADWLRAWAASTREHGAASLQAYAAVSGAEAAAMSGADAAAMSGADAAVMSGADAAALADSTLQAAADLGWGRWTIEPLDEGLQLQVHGSPFVQGWRAAQPVSASVSTPVSAHGCAPVCAPISGLFTALAAMLLHSPVQVTESACAAAQGAPHDRCTFAARRLQP